MATNIQGSIFIAGNKYLFFSKLMYVGHSKIFECFSQHLRMVLRMCVCTRYVCIQVCNFGFDHVSVFPCQHSSNLRVLNLCKRNSLLVYSWHCVQCSIFPFIVHLFNFEQGKPYITSFLISLFVFCVVVYMFETLHYIIKMVSCFCFLKNEMMVAKHKWCKQKKQAQWRSRST